MKKFIILGATFFILLGTVSFTLWKQKQEKSPDYIVSLNEDIFYKKKNLFLTAFFEFPQFKEIKKQHLCSLEQEIILLNETKKHFYDTNQLKQLFSNKCHQLNQENVLVSFQENQPLFYYRTKNNLCRGAQNCFNVIFEKDNRFVLYNKKTKEKFFFLKQEPFIYQKTDKPFYPTQKEKNFVQNQVAFEYMKGMGIGNQLFSFWTSAVYAKKNKKALSAPYMPMFKFLSFDIDPLIKNTRSIMYIKTFFDHQIEENEHDVSARKDILLLKGYMQAYQNLKGYDDEIRQSTHFLKPLTDKNLEIAQKMQQENSVAIHVRRGDYLKFKDIYYQLTPAYYQKAIDYMNQHLKNTHFYVFSDDIEWCQENLKLVDNMTFVNWNKAPEDDLQLMSQAKHFIIANSTFSWWGAFLSKNKYKITIIPQNWYKEGKQGHFYQTPHSVIFENE